MATRSSQRVTVRFETPSASATLACDQPRRSRSTRSGCTFMDGFLPVLVRDEEVSQSNAYEMWNDGPATMGDNQPHHCYTIGISSLSRELRRCRLDDRCLAWYRQHLFQLFTWMSPACPCAASHSGAYFPQTQ